jgi:hypothetical protein
MRELVGLRVYVGREIQNSFFDHCKRICGNDFENKNLLNKIQDLAKTLELRRQSKLPD